MVKRDSPSKHPTSKLSPFSRLHIVVRKRFPIRTVIQNVVIVVLAVCIVRSGPVLRFYARNTPIWGARGKIEPQTDIAAQVVAGARAQIGSVYDASYAQISYPGGDVQPDRGACSDVVVRALRHAGIDLQRLIHEDILRAPSEYPKLATTSEADTNIDHRRCLNQMRFFGRHAQTLTTEVSDATRDTWQPGDIVYWRQPGDRQHVGVLSDRANAKSFPLVIHNGSVCMEQNCLTDWVIIGHYRYAR